MWGLAGAWASSLCCVLSVPLGFAGVAVRAVPLMSRRLCWPSVRRYGDVGLAIVLAVGSAVEVARYSGRGSTLAIPVCALSGLILAAGRRYPVAVYAVIFFGTTAISSSRVTRARLSATARRPCSCSCALRRFSSAIRSTRNRMTTRATRRSADNFR